MVTLDGFLVCGGAFVACILAGAAFSLKQRLAEWFVPRLTQITVKVVIRDEETA